MISVLLKQLLQVPRAMPENTVRANETIVLPNLWDNSEIRNLCDTFEEGFRSSEIKRFLYVPEIWRFFLIWNHLELRLWFARINLFFLSLGKVAAFILRIERNFMTQAFQSAHLETRPIVLMRRKLLSKLIGHFCRHMRI